MTLTATGMVPLGYGKYVRADEIDMERALTAPEAHHRRRLLARRPPYEPRRHQTA
jgi:hypothetical protein